MFNRYLKLQIFNFDFNVWTLVWITKLVQSPKRWF